MEENKKSLRMIYTIIAVMTTIIVGTMVICLFLIKDDNNAACIATIVGGAIGGIGTLIAIIFTTRQAHKQSELTIDSIKQNKISLQQNEQALKVSQEQNELSNKQLRLTKYEKLMREYKELLFLFAQLEDTLKTQTITNELKEDCIGYCNKLLDFYYKITIYFNILKNAQNSIVMEDIERDLYKFLQLICKIKPYGDVQPEYPYEKAVVQLENYTMTIRRCSEKLREELKKISEEYMKI